MQHYLRYLAICLMLLIGTHRVAIAEGQAQVDQIFALFDSGEAMTRESIEQNLSLLEKLISSDDVERIEKLNLLKCWNQPFETEEDVLHSLQHIEQTMAQIPPHASPHFITDFTLCHAWFLQQKGDINGAMLGYTKSIQSAYEHEDIRLIADARSLRGALYSYIGDFSEALDDLVTAQGLYESLNLTG
ncbi:hypothetical protein ACE02P_03970 [Shewanella bicestrii]